MITQFFMAMNPPRTTHQEKQIKIINGKPIVYEPEKLKEARAKLMAHLSKHVPEEKYTSAVTLQVKWIYYSKDKKKWRTYKDTRPDTDNLNKLLKDCMTECGYWTDDALVVQEIIEKFWDEIPGIFVRVENI